MATIQELLSEVQRIKPDCNTGYISSFLAGLVLFYYINSIRNCDCVNKEYINIIEKCFIINCVFYIIRCNMENNDTMLVYLFWGIILVGIYYIYNIRLLINDIYKKDCECGDTTMTYVMSVLNYIMIAKYAFMFSLLFLVYVLTNRENNFI